MNFKNTNAEVTTITRDLKAIEDVTGNIYESVVAIAKRSNQISVDLKRRINCKKLMNLLLLLII